MTTGVRRDRILTFIEDYTTLHGGQTPSLQEIAEALHISKTTVDRQVKQLIAEGYARREDGKLWLTQPSLFSTSASKK